MLLACKGVYTVTYGNNIKFFYSTYVPYYLPTLLTHMAGYAEGIAGTIGT